MDVNPSFHIELLPPGNKLKAVMKGDNLLIAQMITTAMMQRPEIAYAIVSACGMYADTRQMTMDQVKNVMGKKPG